MKAPGVARGPKRAFLAPVWLLAILALLAVFAVGSALLALWDATARGGATVIVLRHAEKSAEPVSDPPLSVEGIARAARLANLLGGAQAQGRPAAIFISDTRRSAETAAPLAARLGLAPQVIAKGEPVATARRVLADQPHGTSVVIGHANTLPLLVSELTRGRFTVPADESTYDAIYVINRPAIGPASLVVLRY